MTKRRKTPASQPNNLRQANPAHRLAQALCALRLDLKALAAALSEDGAIAHPSGISINKTEFHVDALSEVRKLAISLNRTCFTHMFECHHAMREGGSPEIVAALRAIRIYLERVAEQLESRHFTNDARMIAAMQAYEARDLCALALEHFSIKNLKEIEAEKCSWTCRASIRCWSS